MAGGGGGRSLEQTPTWAVASVCFVLVVISITIEHIFHLIGKWLTKKHKRALYEALEKIKSELMLLGFLSLLLTVGQGFISGICIPKSVGNTWHPCSKDQEEETYEYDNTDLDESSEETDHGRKLLMIQDSAAGVRRVLATAGSDKCAAQDKVPFVSSDGIHQLHIFIFILAVSHVLYCIITMVLGKAKMRRWKMWEKETRTIEYQYSHDPERFRFTRQTSFGRRHLNFWSKSPILLWIMCFFRQFFRSVLKVDYLTLRHGFIRAHLAPASESQFDFQKYIARSLEEDFKVVVGISPIVWLFAVLFLLSNAHDSRSFLWLPFLPLIIILMVATKLQVIITKMGLSIQERGEVVKGVPVVQVGDDLFWFNRPRFILYLIHFVLFQNAFQLSFFVWSWYEFGYPSCFHERLDDVIIRISIGTLVQFLCSYVTLPLYALVTQMGSTMKPTIFNDRIATALRKWHHTARKHIKQNRNSGSVSPMSSRPMTPAYGMSPVHLLRHYRSEIDSNFLTSPRMSNFDNNNLEAEGSLSPSHYQTDDGPLSNQYEHHGLGEQERETHDPNSTQQLPLEPQASAHTQHEISFGSAEFSFDKRSCL